MILKLSNQINQTNSAMNRKGFIKGFGIIAPAILVKPNLILGQDKPDAYQKEVVSAFVGAGHSNMDKVKEL